MTVHKLLKVGTVFLLSILSVPVLAWQMIPDRVIEQFVVGVFATRGCNVQAQHLGTMFPLGIKVEGLSIGDASAPFLFVNHAKLRLNLLPIFTGKVVVNLEGAINTGNIQGKFTLHPVENGRLNLENLELGSLPVLANLVKGSIKGVLQLDAEFKQAAGAITGEAKLRINSLSLSKTSVSSIPLPDVIIPETRGLLKINGPVVHITNLAMQGEGIDLRLSGSLPIASATPLALSLELMPTAELMERQKSVFLLMLPYQISPGNFRLSIGGTLSNPQLAGG